MRVAAWLGALAVVAVFSTGLVLAAHRPATTAGLTASHEASALLAAPNADGAQTDPPHVIPAPSPSPSAPATSKPASPPSGTSVRVAAPSIVVRSLQQRLINQDRVSRGLPPLTWSGCLYNVALANARRIAAQGYLSHTNGPQTDLTCGLGYRAGENIGYWSLGVNDYQLNRMFMASPEHYANIMGPYRYVATAWVVASNGYGYIAVEFS
jgi:uncharacterized protein YkwD